MCASAVAFHSFVRSLDYLVRSQISSPLLVGCVVDSFFIDGYTSISEVHPSNQTRLVAFYSFVRSLDYLVRSQFSSHLFVGCVVDTFS